MSDTHITITGTLDSNPALVLVPEGAPDGSGMESATPLVSAITAFLAGTGDFHAVLRLFRETTLYVEVERPSGDGSPSVRAEYAHGLLWLRVFTNLEQMAWWRHALGHEDEPVDWGALTGAEVLDQVLRMLPRGTGIMVDPIADHVVGLPPVTGIVPDDLAVEDNSGA